MAAVKLVLSSMLSFLALFSPKAPAAGRSTGLSATRPFLADLSPAFPPIPVPGPAPAPAPETCEGKAMGVYPDLSDPTCRKFYRCQPIGPFGKNIKIDMECPPGTAFDPIMYCIPPKLLPPGARCSLKIDYA